MKFEKPKVVRCYVTVHDANGEKPSRYATVYDATPDEVIERLKKGESGRPKPGRQPKAAAPA